MWSNSRHARREFTLLLFPLTKNLNYENTIIIAIVNDGGAVGM